MIDFIKNLSTEQIYNTSYLKSIVKENNIKTLVYKVRKIKFYAKATNNKQLNLYCISYNFTN
jgi:hypothetical protein